MAVRVRNGAKITFGSVQAAVTATHCRIRETDDEYPIVASLSANVVAANTDVLEIDTNGIVITYRSGDLTDAHMDQVVKSYWNGTSMEVDLMVNNTTAVSTAGYSQQTHDGWVFDTVAD